MEYFEKQIDVDVPVTTAYNQWTQFESFPEFMENVKEVRQLDDKRLYWRASIMGDTKEWEAEIVEQIPDSRIAWEATSGAYNSGTVSFEPLDASRTRINLKMGYEPEGAMENIGKTLGSLDRAVESNLELFKEFIESRRVETGAWRGEIRE